jgi:hypothetical protein
MGRQLHSNCIQPHRLLTSSSSSSFSIEVAPAPLNRDGAVFVGLAPSTNAGLYFSSNVV